MKKMKNLFMALLVGMFMLPVMNAAINPNTALESLKIGDVTVDLTKCTEKAELAEGEEEGYVCNVTVPWDSKKLTITATAKTDATINAISQELITEGLDLTNLIEGGTHGFSILVDKTGEASTDYSITVTKAVAEKPVLKTLTIKADNVDVTSELSPAFAADKTNYEITVPYGTKKVSVDATSDADVTIGGVTEIVLDDETISQGGSIMLTRGTASNQYYIEVKVAENPMIALIEAAIEADETLKGKVALSEGSLTDTSAQFVTGEKLDTSNLAKMYSVTFEKGSAVATIIAALKEAMKKDADMTILVPTTEEGTISDADIASVKANGGVIYVPTESGIIWVLDGSKITDEDKGFNASIKINEEIEKELYDKINKLLDPKDGGIVIDFKNEGKLPAGTKVMIATEDYAVGDLLSLYYYNPKTGKLELYKKNLKVETITLADDTANGVIVSLDHTSSYVLLPAKNNAQTGVLNVLLYTVMALGSLAGIVFLLKKKAN